MNIKELANAEYVKCTYTNVPWFTKGKHYRIREAGFYIIDDDDTKIFIGDLDTCHHTFKPVYETETDLDKIKESGIFVVYNNKTTPSHYKGTTQPIDLINAQNLNFNLGNVVKYVCRAGKKKGENILTDLEKAKDYINFEIERVKKWTNANEKN